VLPALIASSIAARETAICSVGAGAVAQPPSTSAVIVATAIQAFHGFESMIGSRRQPVGRGKCSAPSGDHTRRLPCDPR